jgi:hypothetical protein
LSTIRAGIAEFPPPLGDRRVRGIFIVRDANGQALAYVYFEDEAGTALGGQAAHQGRSPAHRRQQRPAVAHGNYPSWRG